MWTWSSRRYGSVSSRNASSSPARARARIRSVALVTLASSHRLFPSPPPQLMTSRRLESRRSVFDAADASTNAASNRPAKRRTEMGTIVMSGPQNVSLDGVVQDPDGEEGFRLGGWFGEFGGKDLEEWNKAALAEALGAEAWLLGRRSYEFFGARWRPRSGELADRLNSMRKYVVSSTLSDPDWNNS